MPTTRLLHVTYAMWADRLALADMVNPVEEGNQTRLAMFDEWLNAPLPRDELATWGESDEAMAGQERMMQYMDGHF